VGLIVAGGVFMGKYRQYDRAFKVEAVRLVVAEGRAVAVVARELGINENMLHRWKTQLAGQRDHAFVRTGNLTPEQAELRCLRRELADVTEERDILKKAIAVFSDRKT
jgi:transposase